MTQKQTALSQLARLALSAVSASPHAERAEAYRVAAVALNDECPDLASLARSAAAHLEEAAEAEADFFQQLA